MLVCEKDGEKQESVIMAETNTFFMEQSLSQNII